MLGSLHLLVHLILEVYVYSIVLLFSTQKKKKVEQQVWNSKIHFFFFNEKAKQNIQCRTIKITLFPSFSGFPLFRIKSKILHTATVPASGLSPS